MMIGILEILPVKFKIPIFCAKALVGNPPNKDENIDPADSPIKPFWTRHGEIFSFNTSPAA